MIRQQKMRTFLIALLGGIWAVAMPTSFAADAQMPTQVATVFIVEGPPTESYAPQFDEVTAIFKKHGMNVERELWRTGFGGTQFSQWILVVKYATPEDFAKSGDVVNSPEYQAAYAETVQKGFKVLSSALQFRVR